MLLWAPLLLSALLSSKQAFPCCCSDRALEDHFVFSDFAFKKLAPYPFVALNMAYTINLSSYCTPQQVQTGSS